MFFDLKKFLSNAKKLLLFKIEYSNEHEKIQIIWYHFKSSENLNSTISTFVANHNVGTDS